MRARVARRECWCTHSCFMTSSLPFSVKGATLLARTAVTGVPGGAFGSPAQEKGPDHRPEIP
jgi:hypothetical protein